MLALRAAPTALAAVALLSIGCSSGGADAAASDDAGSTADVANDPASPPKLKFGPGTKLDPGIAWQGYPAGVADPVTIHLGDFADPDGTIGIDAIFVSEEQITCDACVEETNDLLAVASSWASARIAVLQLVIFDANGKPAAVSDALDWKNHFQVPWAVAADPAFTFHEDGSNPLPVQLVIDPRTLTVTARFNGIAQAAFASAEQLAQKNKP